MSRYFVILTLFIAQLYGANIIAKANANLTTNTTWGVTETGASAEQTTRSSNTNTTTSYVYSSAFTCTNTDVIDGMLLRVNRVTTTGTVSVALSDDNGTTATREVTVNASDLPADAAWVFFKFGSTLTADGGADYKVGIKGSSAGNATFYRDGTAGNWARLLRTTADHTPVAGDNFYVAGEWTGAASNTIRLVTVNETATTDYGTLDVGQNGTVAYDTGASLSLYLRASGEVNIWSGGAFYMGDPGGTCIPSTSSAKLNLDSGSNVQYGVLVNNGGTFKSCGATKTYLSYLAANASAGATSLTTSTSTSWLNGDEIALAPTTRTASEAEKKSLTAGASGTTLTIAALTNAHSGTSPTQAELGNLTRNVQIFGASASLQAYFYVGPTATVDMDYTELYWMGSGTANKRGVDVAITTGSFSASYSTFHDFTVSSSIGIYVSALTSGTFNFDHNIVAFTNDACFQNVATTNTSYVIDSNFFLRNTTGGNCVTLVDFGGTYTNNISAGGVASGVAVTDTGAWGTISGNVSHSNAQRGFTLNNNPAAIPTMSSTTAWRNGWEGIYYFQCCGYGFVLDGYTAFGNGLPNLQFNSYNSNVLLNNMVLSGDSTFSTGGGLSTAGGEFVINNSTFGVVSGIKTAHTSWDIYLSNHDLIATGSNVTLASATPFSTANDAMLRAGFDKFGGVDGANRSYRSSYFTSPILITQTDTAIYNTAAPSQRIAPLQAVVKSTSSAKTVAVASGSAPTFTVWVRKSVSTDSGGANYNGAQPRLMVQTNQSCGIGTGAADVVLDTMTVAVGNWEQLTGTTAAVTANCVLRAYVDGDGTVGWFNVDDWSVTNGTVIGDEKYWSNGTTNLTIGGSTPAAAATLGAPFVR